MKYHFRAKCMKFKTFEIIHMYYANKMNMKRKKLSAL